MNGIGKQGVSSTKSRGLAEKSTIGQGKRLAKSMGKSQTGNREIADEEEIFEEEEEIIDQRGIAEEDDDDEDFVRFEQQRRIDAANEREQGERARQRNAEEDRAQAISREWDRRPEAAQYGDDPDTNYKPTQDELLELCRYWATTRLNAALDRSLYGRKVAATTALILHAGKRLSLIAMAIGIPPCRKIVAEVEEQARRRIGDEKWQTFLHGSENARHLVAIDKRRQVKGEQSMPYLAASHIAKELVNVFPYLDSAEIDTALEHAAKLIEWGNVPRPVCEHDWKHDRESRSIQHCSKCRAKRDRPRQPPK